MSKKFHRNTFKLTEHQHNWLEEQSEQTGLNKVEIVRRALDAYRQTEESREERRMFTTQQRRDIKIIARQQGISETQVVKQIIHAGLIRISEKPIKAR